MATFYLINNIRLGSRQLYAGQLINDAQVDVSKIRGAGGVIVRTTHQRVADAAAIAQKARRRGVPPLVLAELMEAALNHSHDRFPKGADISATGNVFWSDGRRRTITGLVGNITITIKVTAGADGRLPEAGDRIEFSRTDTGAFTVALANDGPAQNTLATLVASKVGGAEVEFNGTDWELVNANPV